MVVEVKIDYEKCERCGNCLKACSFGVIEWLDEQPIVANVDRCGGCGECMKNCPKNAIKVKEK